jgi:hypothetical protein
MASPVLGDKSTCRDCKRPITFVGRFWEHDGDNKPRHIAEPVEVGRPAEGVTAHVTGQLDPTTMETVRAVTNLVDFFKALDDVLVTGIANGIITEADVAKLPLDEINAVAAKLADVLKPIGPDAKKRQSALRGGA